MLDSMGINRDRRKRLHFCDVCHETADAIFSIYVDQWLYACLDCVGKVAEV